MTTQLPLETLTVTTNSLEASVLQQLLEVQGIQAFVEGGAGADNFGGNSLVTAKIKIAAADLPRAQQILDDLRHQQSVPWYCQPCREVNEGSFELCWKCGQAREEIEGPMPEELAADLDHGGDQIPSEDRLRRAVAERPTTHDHRPYAPPRTADSDGDNDANLPARLRLGTPDAKLTEQIEFGYRLCIFGFVTLPGVIHLWSLLLLLSTFWSTAELSYGTRQLRSIALVINSVVLLVALTFMLKIVTGK